MIAEDVRKMEHENERLRDENAELRKLLGDEPPKPMTCGCCKHFIQHYIKTGSSFWETCAGHCVHGRVVSKKPDGKTCRYFELGRRKFF